MPKSLFRFLNDEQGAVTIDWVVLTAAAAGISVAVIASVTDGALDATYGLGAHLENQQLASY